MHMHVKLMNTFGNWLTPSQYETTAESHYY